MAKKPPSKLSVEALKHDEATRKSIPTAEYLRDRLTVARDLLTDSGSIFVQIGDENGHRVRAVMDEIFGDENCCSEIVFRSGVSG